MSAAVAAYAAVGLFVVILIPLLVAAVRKAKRKPAAYMIAYSLFFGWERMFTAQADHTELAQDPEGHEQPGTGAPPPL